MPWFFRPAGQSDEPVPPASVDSGSVVGVPASVDSGSVVGVPASVNSGSVVGVPASVDSGSVVGVPASVVSRVGGADAGVRRLRIG